jgi:carbamoyltransferase
MDSSKPTLAIYGIQDRIGPDHPGYVHDHNMALMSGGKVIKLLQLERTTRRKRDNHLHQQLTVILRKEKLLSPADYDLVFVDNVVGRAFISTDGQARFEAPLNQKLVASAEKGRCWWYGKEHDAWVVNHELAHVFSTLPFTGGIKHNSLLVHFDGGASLSNFSGWIYRDKQLTPLEYNWDLKYLTTLFNANALAFGIIGAKMDDQNSVPGKMMGYASYGSHSPELEQWLSEHQFFEDIWGKRSVFFQQARTDWNWQGNSFDQKDPFLQDIIATMQHIFQRDFLKKLRELREQTGCKNLYYSGGCALNIVTNSRIVNEDLFDFVSIPPCCEDSGLALGAAAYIEWLKHGKIERHSPYLNNWGLLPEKVNYTKETLEQIATDLIDNRVIGIANGAGESGPRALGNRSIIARADSAPLARKVSMEHKGREWYRPVAPIMLERNTKTVTGIDEIHPLSRYMLLDFAILPEKRKEMEGVVHVDGTSRIQTIFQRGDNPFLFDLLELLDEKYGLKALINTSFNQRGEPIVHTPEDALASAKAMQLDGVVLNGKYSRL